jgi:hypothetical protein
MRLRPLLLLLVFAAALPAAEPPPPPEFVQAVEFPYYLYPRTLWERELVWLKTVGIAPWNFPSHGTGIKPTAASTILPAPPARAAI